MIGLSNQRYGVLSLLLAVALTTTTRTQHFFVHGQMTTTPSDVVVYTDCSVDDFYSSLVLKSGNDVSQWSRADIINLLTSMHRTVLPSIGAPGNNNSSVALTSKDGSSSTMNSNNEAPDSIMVALVDLFPGSEVDTIREWFRDIDMAVKPINTPETWRRGDAWPRTAGAVATSPAGTDVHTKWPIDWTVNDVVQNLLMGECNVVNSQEACTIPAIPEETALDTAMDGKIKTPPVSKRGDVARALMYNALRYEDELGLTLTDCPPFGPTDYGYLSMLLKWHIDDPVDDTEINRNTRACSRWQGNRNIFVDYPELVEQHFGTPDTIADGTYLYSKCTTPTESPTATPNDCSSINPGDVQIYLFNTNNVPPPNDAQQLASQVVFFPLNEIPGTVENLYLTDRAWNGTDFVTDEGVVKVCEEPKKKLKCPKTEHLWVLNTHVAFFFWLCKFDSKMSIFFVLCSFIVFIYRFFHFILVQYDIPEEGIAPGDVFAYGVSLKTDKGSWTDVSSLNGSASVPLLLSTQTGDSIFLYCVNADDKPHFITGLVYNSGANWSEAGLVQYGFNESSLPDQLKDANEGYVALPLSANYLYTGPQSGKRSELVVAFANPNNYNSSLTAFKIDTSDTKSSATTIQIVSRSIIGSLLVATVMLAFL